MGAELQSREKGFNNRRN